MAPLILPFVVFRLSFGYLAGFYFAGTILALVWLSFFSERAYDQVVSLAAFLALFVTSPLPRAGSMSVAAFERVLACLPLLTVVAVMSPQRTISDSSRRVPDRLIASP